jgi:APA family basic amino acid/polyamine antiporter
MTLGRRVIPVIGLAGCLLLAVLLPISSVLLGTGVVLIGALGYWLRRQYSSRSR